MSIEQTVARKVRSRRRELNLTQDAASQRAKIARKTWSDIETGHRRRMLVRTLVRIAIALDVTPDFLLGYDLPKDQ